MNCFVFVTEDFIFVRFWRFSVKVVFEGYDDDGRFWIIWRMYWGRFTYANNSHTLSRSEETPSSSEPMMMAAGWEKSALK